MLLENFNNTGNQGQDGPNGGSLIANEKINYLKILVVINYLKI